MRSGSNLAELQETGFVDTVRRNPRRPYRHKIRTLLHLNLDASHVAILRDLNEFGIAMQTVTSLAPDQEVHLGFELPAPRVRIEAVGRVVWTDSWGQAGVQFLDLPQRSQRLLKEWIFSQVLTAAYLFSPCESVPVEGNRAEGATELLFSASPRPAIQLEPQQVRPSVPDARPRGVRLLWYPFPISLPALSKLVDGLVVLCSVLLFAVMSMAMTKFLPTWPVTLALTTGVTAVFGALYWFLFAFWIGSTPGGHLASLARSEWGNGKCGEEEDQARFR
jgi:PilZ domain